MKHFYSQNQKTVYKPLSDVWLNCGITIFYLEDGDNCWQLAEKMAMAISQIGVATALDNNVLEKFWCEQILRQGITACQLLIFSNSWKKENLKRISQALQLASELEEVLNPVFLITAQILKKG